MTVASLSRKSSCMTEQWFGVYGKAQPKAPRLVALSRCLCSYPNEQGSSLTPTSSFLPGEAMSPLPNALQEGELFLTEQPMGSSDHAAHFQALVLLPTGTLLNLPGLTLAMAWTSKILDVELQWL